MCIDCEVGKSSKERNDRLSTCFECQPGKYYKSGGSFSAPNECLDCPENHYSTELRQEFCLTCPKGTDYPKTGGNSSSVCTNCTEGYFNNLEGSNCKVRRAFANSES